MLKQMLGAAASAALLLSATAGLTGVADGSEPVPLKTWYTSPAENWEAEATPMGNGFLGATVFGGVERDRILLNEHTLWSGGPGSVDGEFNYGVVTESADAKKALNELRGILQELATDFTENKSAHRDANGSIVAYDYSYGSYADRISELEKALYGDRGRLGSYQSFGNLYITDASRAAPYVKHADSTAEPDTSGGAGGGEGAASLFDGNTGSKWFAGNTGRPDPGWPVTVTWDYSRALAADGYSLTSANDVPDRDPKDWKLYGSADGEDYTLIDEQSGVTFADRGETKHFSLSGAASYTYYKLEISATAGGTTPPQLAEITLSSPQPEAVSYTDYTRSLDLRQAVTTVSYKQEGVTYTKEYFVSNPGNVLAVRLTASEKGKLTRQISIESEQTKKTVTAAGDTITMTGQPADQMTHGLHFAGQVKVVPTGGSMEALDGAIEVTGADEVLLLLSAGTDYVQCTDGSGNYFSEEDPLESVQARVTAAASKGYAALLKAHVDDYGELFSRVELSLGAEEMPAKSTDALLSGYTKDNTAAEDRYLEQLYYQFGRYLLIASSREGSLPANLQGIWADGLNPPWNADYHTNINVQMNYWLAEQTNLAECHTPMIDYINSLVTMGEYMADYYWARPDGGDVRGWAVNVSCNIWNHVGSNDSEIGLVPTPAAWMCQDIWEVYQYNQDKTFLKENYDTILGAALFWVDNLWEDERDGRLVVNPSYSPENGGLSLGTAFDQAVVWEVFNEVLQASEILGYDTLEVQEIREAQKRLSSGLRIGLAGQFMEWKDETLADIHGSYGHRHVNQLFSLHPGNQVVAGRSEEDDRYIEAMKKTLELRGDGGTGWSKAWKINFWARLRDGDHAGVMVNQILRESTTQNLFDTHPPFQIDGNFGATAGMTEMLLQSQGDSIDLLPALPAMWADGSVRGIRARGNFELSMRWAEKLLTEATVTAVSGGDCTLRYRGLSGAKVVRQSDGKEITAVSVDEDTITFPSEAGETYLLTNIPQIVELNGLGDINGDGKVDTTDARLALQYAVGKIGMGEDEWIAGDVNQDNKVDTTDARLILQYAVGKIDRFPKAP